jgi:hypothetical protein
MHTNKCWREEQLVLGKADCWGIAEALDLYLLHVYLRVVENELGCKVVESWRFRTEFYYNNLERLSSDEADLWENFKSVC